MIRLALVALLLVTRRASAEPAHTVDADMHFGFATSPFDAMPLPEAKGHALTFMAGGHYVHSAELAFGIRVPVVLASVAQPAGSYVDRSAIGNPQLGGSYRWLLNAADGLAVTAGVDLGLPIATHDSKLVANRALAIANGVEGLARPEWFTPGTLPITTFANLARTSRTWGLEIAARVPLLVRTSDADLPQTHAVGVAAVLAVGGWRQLSRRLSLAPAAQLFVDAAPVAEHGRSASRVQDLERVSLVISGARATFSIDLQTAIGGELGGSMFGLGLRTTVVLP